MGLVVSRDTYMPLMRGKNAEFRSLQDVSPAVRARLRPVMLLAPVPWDYQEERRATTLEAHLEKAAERLASSWDEESPLRLDPLALADDDEGIAEARRMVHDLLAQRGGRAIPVVRPTASGVGDADRAAVREVVARDGLGVTLALDSEVMDSEGGPVELAVGSVESLGQSPTDVDLVVDFGGFPASQAPTVRLAAVGLLSLLRSAADWRSLVFAGCSFPATMGEVGRGETRLPRAEWQVWQRLARDVPDVAFGDYVVDNPASGDVDLPPWKLRFSANLRYTTPDEYLILKARDAREYGFDQMFDLYRHLVGLPDFRGPAFSWGDSYIDQGSRREVTSGNATTWRRIADTHHFTQVVEQLANSNGA